MNRSENFEITFIHIELVPNEYI